MEPSIISKKKLPPFEEKLLSIVNEGLLLSRPSNMMKGHIKKLSKKSIKIGDKTIDLSGGKLYVLGWGKVAGPMAEAVESILGTDIIEEGIIVSNSIKPNLKKIRFLKGSHPFPSKNNIHAAKEIIKLAKKCKENDYVICLISGGGSSLLCLPVPEISLDEKMEATKMLVKSGMDVERINIVRKHLSGIKGGRLAEFIYPANIINLIISDDVNNEIYSIASGPTVADKSTFADALQIIEDYNIKKKLPLGVVRYLQSNLGKKDRETLKEDPQILSRTINSIIYDNKALLENLKQAAIKQCFKTVKIYPEMLCGDVDIAIGKFSSFINNVRKKSDYDFLVLAGGEVEIKAKEGGKGGRAQHFAALMAPQLSRFKNSSVFAAVASDGNDFIKGIAGAMVNNRTMNEIERREISYMKYIKETDTFHLHEKLESHLFTIKPTQTNVFDIYVFGQKKTNK